MKKFLIVLLFSLSTTATFSTEIKSFDNINWKWVEVLNKDVKSGNSEVGIDHLWVSRDGLPFISNVCGIGGSDNRDPFNNKVKIIGELSDGEYILEYSRDGVAYGSRCPSGVFFKGKLSDFIK